ncbi:MAG: OmpA family protein [Blastocatellia bacterium]|nr:OmpA family protein [Blastocatellia bacterium]
MSDSNQNPGPPPDDWDKTRPNIKLPDTSGGGDSSDWDKTNYNFPKQPAGDEWGKTVTNLRPLDTDNQDYGKTMTPGASNAGRDAGEVDWGFTRPNINISDSDFGPSSGGGGGQQTYDKTTPYFQLPESERQKYQQLPPTPTEQAAQDEQDRQEKGGIPMWVWITAGLMMMFFFAILVLVVAYFGSSQTLNFNVTVRMAPSGSDVRVDNAPWGITRSDGSIELVNLSPGRKVITIEHPSYECTPLTVEGGNGVNPAPLIAECSEAKGPPPEDCVNIRLGEEDKAERCYNSALDALPDPFTPEDLVKALNILIINFESGKFDVPPRRLAALQKGAKFIQKLPADITLEVGGHTDNRGSDASNQVLSDNRAKAVKDTLTGFGVRQDALLTRGFGAARPKTENETEQGRFYNRRIEYSVVKK